MPYDKYGFDAGKNKSPVDDTSTLKTRIDRLESIINTMNKGNNCPIPVGGIFISTKATSPDKLWPNTTWTAVSSGRTLIQYAPGSGSAPVNKEAYDSYHETYGGNGFGVQQYDISTPKSTIGSWNTTFKLSTASLPPHAHPFSPAALHHTHDLVITQGSFDTTVNGTLPNGAPKGITANHRVYSDINSNIYPSSDWGYAGDNQKVYYTMRTNIKNWQKEEFTGQGIDSDGAIRASSFPAKEGVSGKTAMQSPISTSRPNVETATAGVYMRLDDEDDGSFGKDKEKLLSDGLYAAQSSDERNSMIVANNVQPSFVVCMWYRES